MQIIMHSASFSLTSKQFNQLLFLFSWLFILTAYFTCPANGGFNISSRDNVMCMDHEREALLKFKQGIQDDCGVLSSWSDYHNKECCQWYGILCSNHTGHVIKLNLRGIETLGLENYCLRGELGSSLVDLKHLKYLDLSNNDFTGQSIPYFIGSLSKLKHLDLSHANFQGEIPHQLGNLSHLTFLDLSSHFLNENLNVTSLSWLSNLNLLKYINLNGVDLSKAIDWLKIINNLPFLRVVQLESCNLPSITLPFRLSYKNSSTTLSFINLSYNSLNNSLIFQWLLNLTGTSIHLEHLDLSWNNLEGPFPSGFGDLTSLSFLDLSGNKLGGNLPSTIGDMQSLSYVSFAHNQFEGPVPHTISNMKLLKHFDLSSNNFSILPITLGKLCNLQELNMFDNNLADELDIIFQSLIGCASKSLLLLDLSANKIWGRIPDKIGIFSSLKELQLGGNQLNGTVSQNLGQLSMLKILSLSSNKLQGNLSHHHFLNLSQLNSLDLSYNPSLVVNIEANWIPPFQLENIILSSCILGPNFPMWIVSQNNYTELDMSSSSISDTIPESFSSALPSKLHYLDISDNKIYGQLPNFADTLLPENEPAIDLSFNNIEGSIPSFPRYLIKLYLNNNRFSDPNPFLCPQTKIVVFNLDLSDNLLSGKLPDCWSNFDQLSILHLENNYFSGAIPASIGHLNQLEVLHLRNNSFVGETPRSFKNLTSLVILDLGHNSLGGNIEQTIGNSMTTLAFLSFQGNRFSGRIPLSLCQMSNLQILDLSANHITGTIPNCIYNLTAMQNGTNLLQYLQYDIKDLGFFHIDVDATKITWKGKERNIGNALGLVKVIDLSKNKLQGEIPMELYSLTGLVSLDLSSNNLAGSINPKIGQLTALQFLDLSDNQLSGKLPTSLTDLNFLGVLDLSYNHFSGQIPTGTLLQSFNASTYVGNPGLCGLPLPKCPSNRTQNNDGVHGEISNHNAENGNDGIFPGLYISVILGFIIGFWGVVGSLVLKTTWRRAFFQFIEDARDKICGVVSVSKAGVQRKM